MLKLFKKVTHFITGYFKLIEEHSQLSTIRSIKSDNGAILIKITPIYSEQGAYFTPEELLTKSCLTTTLNAKDILIIKALVLSRGDIFIESKSFGNQSEETLNLASILTQERWSLTQRELEADASLFSRLNIKFLKKELSI